MRLFVSIIVFSLLLLSKNVSAFADEAYWKSGDELRGHWNSTNHKESFIFGPNHYAIIVGPDGTRAEVQSHLDRSGGTWVLELRSRASGSVTKIKINSDPATHEYILTNDIIRMWGGLPDRVRPAK